MDERTAIMGACWLLGWALLGWALAPLAPPVHPAVTIAIVEGLGALLLYGTVHDGS